MYIQSLAHHCVLPRCDQFFIVHWYSNPSSNFRWSKKWFSELTQIPWKKLIPLKGFEYMMHLLHTPIVKTCWATFFLDIFIRKTTQRITLLSISIHLFHGVFDMSSLCPLLAAGHCKTTPPLRWLLRPYKAIYDVKQDMLCKNISWGCVVWTNQ